MKPARLATLAILPVLAAACTPAGPRAGRRAPGPGAPAPGLPTTEPVVRVGLLVDTTAVAVSADGRMSLSADGRRLVDADGHAAWTVRADGTGRLVASDGRQDVGPVTGPLTVRADGGASVQIGGKPYRGSGLIVATGPGRVTAVNVLELEQYLLGVVPSEMPSLALEAVKAQAVAARTYAIGNLGSRRQLGFDFYASVADQAYGGMAREDSMAARAVRETRGQIITDGGAPILAYYHSTCGGRTAAIDQVWHRAPLPYLRSVSDADPEGGYYCESSSRFDWREEWSGDALRDIVSRTLADAFDVATSATRPIEALEVESRTTSGRVAVLRIDAGGHSYRVHGDSTRWILRPAAGRILNSSLFRIVTQERHDGRVTRLAVEGHGWGHGIGMCQMGAIGRARAGQDYREILRAYYSGTDVSELY